MCMRLVPGKNNVSVKTTHRTSQQHVLISLLLVEQTYACHCLGIMDGRSTAKDKARRLLKSSPHT